MYYLCFYSIKYIEILDSGLTIVLSKDIKKFLNSAYNLRWVLQSNEFLITEQCIDLWPISLCIIGDSNRHMPLI